MPDTVYWSLVDASLVSLEESSKYLSPAETRKLSALRFPKRRSEWLLGRWTAKSLVQSIPAYQHFPLNKIEIRNTPKGAPYFNLLERNIPWGCLSVSHRDNLAFCAFTSGPDLKIGADIEKIEPRVGNFAADYFTQAEQMLVGSQPINMKDMLTTLIWSAKEAILKALGVGLRWDTRQVEVSEIKGLDAPSGEWQEIQVTTRLKDRRWFACWQNRGDYILTLACLINESAEILIVEQNL